MSSYLVVLAVTFLSFAEVFLVTYFATKWALVKHICTTGAASSFTETEAALIRTRALIVDTGDGVGTFTTEEIGKLKELAGTVLETVDEIVTQSFPDHTLTGATNSENAAADGWYPQCL
jgi:hypothetical protein